MNKEQIQIVVLIAIFTVAAFVGTHLLLVKPGLQNKSGLIKKNEGFIKEIRENKSVANRKAAIVQEIEEVNKKVADFKKSLIVPSEFDFFRDTLRDMGSEYNVKVLRDSTNILEGGKKSVFKENLAFTEKEISLSLVSKYHDFGSFVNRVENTSPFRKVVSFTISGSGGGRRSRRGGAEKKDTLKIDLKILSLLVENPA